MNYWEMKANERQVRVTRRSSTKVSTHRLASLAAAERYADSVNFAANEYSANVVYLPRDRKTT